VYFRYGVSEGNPGGAEWHAVAIKKGFEACQVTVTDSGIPFVVTWSGSFLFRTGITPATLIGTYTEH
jgi:hypothetical protein